jgi:hypothetical protein
MTTIKSFNELRNLCGTIANNALERVIEEYREELATFIQKDVYDAYDEKWGGRTGEFGMDVEDHYDINRKGNQYYRTFEIAPNQKPFIDYDPIRRSHYPSKSGGVMTYLDLFNIIENGFTTSEPPPLHFPSHMSPRPFIEDFRNHVKGTLAERFARECASQGVDIDIGSIIVE